MPAPYPQLFADAVVRLYARVTKSKPVARRMQISPSTVLAMVHEQRRRVRRVGRPSRPDRDPVVRS